MFYLIMIALGVIIGLGIKYFSNSVIIKTIELKKMWLLYSIFILQLGYRIIDVIISIDSQNNTLVTIHSITALLALMFMFYNRKQLSVLIVFVGFLLNLLAMIFNNGKMPVLVNEGYMDIKHSIVNSTTRLRWLSDIVSLPYPLNIGLIRASIGDIIVGIGIMFVIVQLISIKKSVVSVVE